ncbi:MAG: hypothetical protein IIB12_08525 [Chloroflexi bacterium]|nr:hypothetical protein [Chloroflexota bacterium]
MDQTTRDALLAMYDVPDPAHPGRVIPGYDKEHAERTTRIVLRVAEAVGLDGRRLADLEITTLLHDLGRTGMDPELFGAVFGLAQERGLPVRIAELRARYPGVTEEQAVPFFLDLLAPALRDKGIPVTDAVTDHVAMRMDFKGRLRRMLDQRRAELDRLGIAVKPWMETVMLYYYYPHGMEGQPGDVRTMGMLLVACENFEAYNNQRRGRDYYGRQGERLREVFTTLEGFRERGLVSSEVMEALGRLTASGELDGIIKESRGFPAGAPLPDEDLAFQRELLASRT